MDKMFLIISLVLYALAPSQFSQPYCWFLFLLFIANVVYVYVRDVRNEKIGFNLLFSLAFFLVSYLYPIFIYPFFPNFQILSIPLFNYDVVTQGTALANIAYACYGVGYIYILNRDTSETEQPTRKNSFDKLPEILTSKQLNTLLLISVVVFVMFVLSGGLTFFAKAYQEGEDGGAGGATGFIWVFFQTFCLLLLLANLRSNSAIVYIAIIIFIILLLKVGTRTLPLNLMVPFFCYYCAKKDLSFTKIAIIGSVAAALFAFVGIARSGGTAMDAAGGDEIAERFRSLIDFIIPNRDLYAIYDHTQEDGITYGISSMSYILAVVPFSQSIFMALTGIPEYMLRSERMTSFWEFGDDPNVWGLGTNIIGDVYLSFGLIGLIALFTFLGYIVAESRRKMWNGSWVGYIIYFVLVSNSVFMCRGAFFYSLKNIVWSLVFIYLIRCLYQEATYDKENDKITYNTKNQ